MSTLTFNAIDVETANSDRASICQIGIAHVRDGQIKDEWKTLVNPKDYFTHTSIHGISESDVEYSPTLPKVHDELHDRLRGSVLVSHTSFDRTAFEQAMGKHDLEQLQVTWLDSRMIARRAWPRQKNGYSLESLTEELGIPFRHHDALEDAKTAAKIVLRACASTGKDIEDWLRYL